MASLVDKVATEPFDWGDRKILGTGATNAIALVENKVASTMQTAEEMLERLVGTDGNSGFLGELNALISSYSAPDIEDFSVTIPTISVTPDTRPAPTSGSIDTDFPTFDEAAPTLPAIPTVDLSGLTTSDIPDEMSDSLSWTETAHNEQLFTDLLARVLSDLQSGATGLDATVEQEIYDRAAARQDLIDDRQEQDTLEFFSARGFSLPTGAFAAAVAELANERARNRTELNGKITIEQAELAQKNSQFIIQVSKDIEAVLRDYSSKQNDRSLDAAKSVLAYAIQIYAENIRRYLADIEGNKQVVELQIANLRAVVENVRALTDTYKSKSEAYQAQVEAKAKKNEAVTSVFKAEVDAYAVEQKAATDAQQVTIEEYKLRLQSADIQLRTAIGQIDAALRAFGTESSLRERVATSMANIAMQAVASSYAAVHANVGLSHSSGSSESESFNHSESRAKSEALSNSLSESRELEPE